MIVIGHGAHGIGAICELDAVLLQAFILSLVALLYLLMTLYHHWKMLFEHSLLVLLFLIEAHIIILIKLKTRTSIERSVLVSHVRLDVLSVDVVFVESSVDLTQPVLDPLPLRLVFLLVHESSIDEYLCAPQIIATIIERHRRRCWPAAATSVGIANHFGCPAFLLLLGLRYFLLSLLESLFLLIDDFLDVPLRYLVKLIQRIADVFEGLLLSFRNHAKSP